MKATICVPNSVAMVFSHFMSLALDGPVLCVVLDPDNMLWSGTLDPHDSEGPGLKPNLAVQEALKSLQARDVSIAVVSTNDIKDLVRPFEAFGMLLRMEDISLFQPDCTGRPESLRRIRDKLGIPFNQTMYLDGDAFQRGLVHATLPEIIVSGLAAEIPPEPDFTGVDDFLKSLDMRMALNRFDEVHLPAIHWMIRRGTQFNLTGRSYTIPDCDALMRDSGALPLYATLADRMGDHGVIGAVVLAHEGAEMVIRDWVMDIAMVDRGVEHELMNRVVALAQSRGCTRLSGEYLRTSKNIVVSEFFAQFGFTMIGEEADHTLWVLPLAAYEPVSTFITGATMQT